MQGVSWLLEAPQFWYEVAACAAFVLAVVAITDLFGARRRMIKVYRVLDPAPARSYYHDRAPIPTADPFCKRPPYGAPTAGVSLRRTRRTFWGLLSSAWKKRPRLSPCVESLTRAVPRLSGGPDRPRVEGPAVFGYGSVAPAV